MTLVWIGIGGAVGALARYAAGEWARRRFPGAGFPLATFAVNLIGSFLLGCLLVSSVPQPAKETVGIGLLGGFTTFSTFSYEVVSLKEKGKVIQAWMYVTLSLAGGILAVWAGMSLVS